MRTFRGGTKIVVRDRSYGTLIELADGKQIRGYPEDSDAYRSMARELAYGDDVMGMCLDHDALHAALADWIGLRESYSLREAAEGSSPDLRARDLAAAEEAAVLAVQKLIRLAGKRIPL